MLKLVCEAFSIHGWGRIEVLFTSGEARTCVEVARTYQEKPAKFRNVVVYDFREAKSKLVTLAPAEDSFIHNPVVVSEVETMLPTAKLLDLSKLPRAAKAKKPATVRIKVLGVVADAESFKPKAPARVSKRERSYGKQAAVLS